MTQSSHLDTITGDRVSSSVPARAVTDVGEADVSTISPRSSDAAAGGGRFSEWRGAFRTGRHPAVLFILLIAVLAFAPELLSEYSVTNLTQILAFTVLAFSLHLLMGWTGILSFGQAAYFGVGAYTAGLIAIDHTPDAAVLLPAGALTGAIAAAVTGWLIVRSHGGYLFMLTLAIGELMALAALTWVDLTGGDNGLAGIPYTEVSGGALDTTNEVYTYALVVFAVVMVVMFLLGRSPVGRTWRGIRDNEPRMRSLGYSTRLYKYGAFCIAGTIAGLAGAVWVAHTQFVSPADLDLRNSALVLIAVAVGGTTRLWGPLIGSAIIIQSQNQLPAGLQGKGPLVLGILLILVVYFLPGGLSAQPDRIRRAVRRWRT